MVTNTKIVYKYPKIKELFENYYNRHIYFNPNIDINDIIQKYSKNEEKFWNILSYHPSNKAVEMMTMNPESIDLRGLVCNTNPNIEPLLKAKLNEFKKTHWLCMAISHNPVVLKFLEKYPENIDWKYLSENTCDFAIHILQKNMNNIVWDILSSNHNPLAVEILQNNQNKINWKNLCNNTNINAIKLLEQNIDKINCFDNLAQNPNALHIIMQHMDKINPTYLSENPNAIDILIKKPELIDFIALLHNPNAISYLKTNLIQLKKYMKRNSSKVIENLTMNPNCIPLIEKMLEENLWSNSNLNYIIILLEWNTEAHQSIFEFDYKAMSKERTKIIYSNLLEKTLHPSRVEKMLNYHLDNGGSFDDFEI